MTVAAIRQNCNQGLPAEKSTSFPMGTCTFFASDIFVQWLVCFSIGLHRAVSKQISNPCVILPTFNIASVCKKWYNARGPSGPDVSAQMRNTSDSGGFLICLILKASIGPKRYCLSLCGWNAVQADPQGLCQRGRISLLEGEIRQELSQAGKGGSYPGQPFDLP